MTILQTPVLTSGSVSTATIGKLWLVSCMRLASVNFVALVLNHNIQKKKKKILLFKYVISCLKLFSLIDVMWSDKTSILFHSAVNQDYINCNDELQYNQFKKSR